MSFSLDNPRHNRNFLIALWLGTALLAASWMKSCINHIEPEPSTMEVAR